MPNVVQGDKDACETEEQLRPPAVAGCPDVRRQQLPSLLGGKAGFWQKCESQMFIGWFGDLKVSYDRDNQLGEVDHQAVGDAVSKLPNAFVEGAGSKKVFLAIAFPLVLLNFIIMACLVLVSIVIFANGTSTGLYTKGSKSTMMTAAIIQPAVIAFWLLTTVCLIRLRAAAVSDGFEGIQRSLQNLNQKMSPLKFSIREEDRRKSTQYFLVIMNAMVVGTSADGTKSQKTSSSTEVGEGSDQTIERHCNLKDDTQEQTQVLHGCENV
jgi:hypothetical protein